jgi:hypothetical protein
MKQLDLPHNLNLPFLSYGSFKPGELRFNLIEPYVASFESTRVIGLMNEKDGVPIFYSVQTKRYAWFNYEAFKIHFKKGLEKEAYQIICENEPNSYYHWETIDESNLLEGKTSLRGLNDFFEISWTFKDDPYFTDGLLSCKEISRSSITNNNKLIREHHVFFCNQSAYMLLWSIIERFCTIKYGNISPTEKLKKLAADPQIEWKFIVNIVTRNDEIVRSDRDKEKLKLDPNSSIKKILEYYYGLRSNMVHRGKDVFGDINRIENAFNELHQIMTEIIRIHH